jgi:mutator protein MutT
VSGPRVVEVAIALVWKQGLILVSRRPPGVHLEGYWEFPGGKLRPAESAEECVVREVLEEVGLRVLPRARRAPIAFEYPERHVRIHPVDVDYLSGEIEFREVSDERFVSPSELTHLRFPEANADLVRELVRAGAGSRSEPGISGTEP